MLGLYSIRHGIIIILMAELLRQPCVFTLVSQNVVLVLSHACVHVAVSMSHSWTQQHAHVTQVHKCWNFAIMLEKIPACTWAYKLFTKVSMNNIIINLTSDCLDIGLAGFILIRFCE